MAGLSVPSHLQCPVTDQPADQRHRVSKVFRLEIRKYSTKSAQTLLRITRRAAEMIENKTKLLGDKATFRLVVERKVQLRGLARTARIGDKGMDI